MSAPVALSILVNPSAPSTVTELLLLMVIAAPGAVTPIEPPPATSMLAGAPLLAVAVAMGAEVEEVIETWAWTWPAMAASKGDSATAATRNLRFMQRLSRGAALGFDGACLIRPQLGAFQGRRAEDGDCHACDTHRRHA